MKNKIISTRKVDVTPHKSLMKKMGDGGHTLHTATGDLGDNALDAMTDAQRAGKEKHIIRINISVSKNTFIISDNGTGMSESEADDAAKLALSNKTASDLGSFGVGMQSALMSLTSDYTVLTSSIKSKTGIEYSFNQEQWERDPDWDMDINNVEIEDPSWHGTIITVPNVNRMNLSAGKIQYLKSDLAKRYRSFLLNGNVDIFVNRVKVRVEDIDWMDGYPTDFNIDTEYGKIHGKIGLMKESSQKGIYGFDIFRNKRMIVTNSKFAIGEHPSIARIAGEIHLDFVKVSHQKNQFKTDSVEYEAAEEACKKNQIFKKILSEARKKLQEGIDKKENKELSTAIHKTVPIINQALKELSNQNIDIPWGKGGEGIVKKRGGKFKDIFKNGFSSRKYNKDQEPQTTDPKDKKEKKDEVKEFDILEVSGQCFKIETEFINDKNMGRKSTQFDEKEKVLTIFYNKGFSGYNATKDTESYTLETINDAIVEFLYSDHRKVVEEVNSTKESLLTATINLKSLMRKTEKNHEQKRST